MIRDNKHIDSDFIPDGLEFKQEYLDAALGSYRRAKRLLILRRAGLALVAMAAIFGIVCFSDSSSQTDEGGNYSQNEHNLTDPQIESGQTIKDTSFTIDLEKNEVVIDEHRPGAAVESVEATQNRSSRTTDQGSSMSSGVGLPGQLSLNKGNLKHKSHNSKSASQLTEANPVAAEDLSKEIDQNQYTKPIEDFNISCSRQNIPLTLAYLPVAPLLNCGGLSTNHAEIAIPQRPFQVFASVGMKLWADHGFQLRPFKTDLTAALGAGYAINKTFSAEFMSRFSTISGVAEPYTVEQRQYATGYTSTTYRYYTDRFYEIGGELQLSCHINKAHAIGIGWSSQYLLTTDNHIETGISSTYETLRESREKARGYVEGYTMLRHSVTMNYEFALGKNKAVGARYAHGLTDVTRDQYFGNGFDRNSMFSVYFKLKLTP